MVLKLNILFILIIAFLTLHAQTVMSSKINSGEVAALYVKDGNSNQFRFLGSGLGSINFSQLIKKKQDLFEQLRPTSGGDTASTTATIAGINNITTIDAATDLSTIAGVKPIVINLGSLNGNGGVGVADTSSALNSAIYGGSPIADILPQIIAQAAVQRRGPNRRRAPNRRPNNGGAKRNRNTQVYVIRLQS